MEKEIDMTNYIAKLQQVLSKEYNKPRVFFITDTFDTRKKRYCLRGEIDIFLDNGL